jgi:catechol 2,3-dioxygenase-like lactoylglutathione lyase family enzyme
MITGLHHVQIAAPPGCEETMRRFYGDVLGFTEITKPADLRLRGGVWFAGPGVELHIGIEDPFQPARKAHPGFLVTDLDALAARLTEVLPHDPLEHPDGRTYRRFHTHDPVGNRLEFLQGYLT